MTVPDEAPQIEVNRLRVALRLCFDPEQADNLAALVRRDADEPEQALAPVVRAARLSYGLRRFVPLKRRRSEAPLRARPSLDSDAALMLALHVALGFESALLASLFRRSIPEVGAGLQRARQVLAGERLESCTLYRPLLGRYRELGAERESQIALLQHAAHCDDCRRALDDARRIDAELQATASAFERALTPFAVAPRRPSRLLAHPRLVAATATLLVLVALAFGAVAARHVLLPARHATPLTAASSNAEPSGWLLEADETGKVDAIDLSSGERRLLIPGVSGTRVDDLISPDHRTIAQTIYLQYPRQPESLRIYDLDGTLRQRWDLETVQYVRTPLAWIDNARLLMTQIPVAAFEPTLNVFTHNVRQNSSLIVLNVESGREQSIAMAGVHLARAAPDGSLLAIEHYGDDATGKLELHSFDGQDLGPALATFEDQPGSFWWSPDSSRLFAVVRDTNGRFALDVIDRTGQARTLIAFGERDIVNLLGISPDGRTLVYTQGSDKDGSNPWAFRQVDVDSGRGRLLANGEPGQLSAAQVSWSPGGDTFVLVNAEPYYLAAGDPVAQPVSYVTLAFTRHGNALGAVLDGLRAGTLLGWLPDRSIPAPLPIKSAATGDVGGATFVAGSNLSLDAFSRLSPDGSRLLLRDQARLNYVAQPLDGDVPQALGFMNDPSWLPDGSGVIGVSAGAGPSRVTLTGTPAGMSRTDPATLGATQAAYRQPLVAPNGLRFSFFVVRGSDVQLWVGGRDETIQPVASWTVPGDARIDPPLVAQWAGNDDLIYLTPDDWRDGLPRRTNLQRWSATSGTVTTLLGWSTRGNEHGILGQELALSRDGQQVAIRLRHFTTADVDRGRTDSIVVAAARDVSQAFEIARDAPGDGLSWSPDGTELVAGMRGRIAVLAANGRTIEYPPLGNAATYPLWLQPDEIWFRADNGSGQTIQRLRR